MEATQGSYWNQFSRDINQSNLLLNSVPCKTETYSDQMEETVLAQYGLKKGLREFREEGATALLKEIKQLHDMKCIDPVSNLTREQK